MQHLNSLIEYLLHGTFSFYFTVMIQIQTLRFSLLWQLPNWFSVLWFLSPPINPIYTIKSIFSNTIWITSTFPLKGGSIFLPREFHGQRSLMGCSPWSHEESDTTEWLTLLFSWVPVISKIKPELFSICSST